MRWTHMASAERQPVTIVGGGAPSGGPGAEPLVRGQETKPLKLKTFPCLDAKRSSKFASFSVFCKLARHAPEVTRPLPSPDLHHSQEQPLAKVRWSTPWVRPCQCVVFF